MHASTMHVLHAFVCLAAGSLLVWAGYRLARRYERPPGATGFARPIVSADTAVGCIAYLLIILGTVLGLVFTLIFLLT